jgi:hypothetical protein
MRSKVSSEATCYKIILLSWSFRQDLMLLCKIIEPVLTYSLPQ